MEDEEFDEDELDEEGEFDLPPHYRRPTFHPARVRPHLVGFFYKRRYC